MKLFLYLFVSILLLGGCYVLFVHETPAASAPAASWESEAQNQLATLLSTQLQAASSRDWKPFDAALAQADAHLAAAPADAQADNFRTALRAYHSQQELRTQLTP